jgi:hypothetical protein
MIVNSDRRFNHAVGRYVLGHEGDQVAFIQDAASCLVSGGALAFLDVDTDLRAPMYAFPHVPLFEDAVSAANEVWAAMPGSIREVDITNCSLKLDCANRW